MLPLRSIICATDLTSDDAPAICHALRLAVAAKASLLFAHADREAARAWDEFPGVRERLTLWGMIPERADKAALEALGLRPAKVLIAGGAEGGLADFISRRRPDLLVLGTHQRTGLGRWLSPSVAEAVARAARVPTLFVPCSDGARGFVDTDSGRVDLARALIPIAHEPPPSLAVQLLQRLHSAIGEARPLEAELLHVGAEDDAPVVDFLPDDTRWRWRYASGSVVGAIEQRAEALSPSLIAMATQGHATLGDRLLGSTVERVLRVAPCPLLAVPPPL